MKRLRLDLESAFEELAQSKVEMKKTVAEGLDVDYVQLLPKVLADELFQQLQENVEYLQGDLSKVKVFGRWHEIPRQQAAYGDQGLKYTFSGITIPAKPWIPQLETVRNFLQKVTGFYFNFVLVNRYRNGKDHISEHRDAEPEIDKNAPIASVSLGQCRQFVLKHGDARKKGNDKRNISPIKIDLKHGSLLLMNPPTNMLWYHSVPPRKNADGIRINLTFRKIII